MSPKIKERLITMGLSMLAILIPGLILYAVAASDESRLTLKNQMDNKPNYSYVDKQDSLLRVQFNQSLVQQEEKREIQFNALNEKLDLIDKNHNEKMDIILEHVIN
jgi:hypothetical protein